MSPGVPLQRPEASFLRFSIGRCDALLHFCRVNLQPGLPRVARSRDEETRDTMRVSRWQMARLRFANEKRPRTSISCGEILATMRARERERGEGEGGEGEGSAARERGAGFFLPYASSCCSRESSPPPLHFCYRSDGALVSARR